MKMVLTAEEMRAAEQPLLSAGVDLMGLAAEGVGASVRRLAPTGPVLVAVGSGNNGGDGLYAAAELAGERQVFVWLAAERQHESGLNAAVNAGCLVLTGPDVMTALPQAALVVDAVAGLGSRPGLPLQVAEFAAACADLAVPVLAIDLPSGVGADGSVQGASFHADHTVTFAALKNCHIVEPAAARSGVVEVIDIGVEAQSEVRAVELADLASWWPIPRPDSDKYSRGVLLIDTGSAQFPGAALLNLHGALYTGVGMVRYVGPVAESLILGRFPSAVLANGRAQGQLIGSGWGSDQPDRLARALDRGIPTVLDAEAILAGSGLPLDGALLTPHAGELARLLGVERTAVEQDPIRHARVAAQQTAATVLLKGARQYVVEPDGRVSVALPGPHWTAQAGSGDVLAGCCAALLASGLPVWQAAVLGASLQALAATRNPGPFPPDVLAGKFPETIAWLVGASAGVAQRI